MPTRLIKKGDTVPRIAFQQGFEDTDRIWLHPNNAELKSSRDPCVLAAGDQLFVPETPSRTFALPTGKRHTIVLKRPKLSLAIVLQKFGGAPFEGVSGTLTCDGTPFPVTAGADGRIEQKIPPSTGFAELKLDQGGAGGGGGVGAPDDSEASIGMLVGHLEPLEMVSGWRARLANLGYPVDFPDGVPDEPPPKAAVSAGGPGSDGAGKSAAKSEGTDAEAAPSDEDSLRLAVEEFQCDNGLAVTGERDGATEAKLLEVHGS